MFKKVKEHCSLHSVYFDNLAPTKKELNFPASRQLSVYFLPNVFVVLRYLKCSYAVIAILFAFFTHTFQLTLE